LELILLDEKIAAGIGTWSKPVKEMQVIETGDDYPRDAYTEEHVVLPPSRRHQLFVSLGVIADSWAFLSFGKVAGPLRRG
jgi:hypothetical protein